MKNFFFQKNKYLIGSVGLFFAAFTTNSAVFQGLASASLLYNTLERNGIIEAEMHPDIQTRKMRLSELLRHHLLKTPSLSRLINEDTLMIAKPVTRFEDQGFIGWGFNKFGIKLWKKQEFTMQADWKDAKFYGEGTAFCIGSYENLENYYFKKITIKVERPKVEEYIILDNNTIDI
ncbi:hypothetical protein SteCoe_37642 [Stentor coeruleus]|uniref:Uncharacterized protein n=1 Tax=Stentor coeruleus TaxID=5963 RepID=A0A1R2AN02_9CILI|nr:hypothetical protein SteCoe_37642 [Stentor coeruleus]